MGSEDGAEGGSQFWVCTRGAPRAAGRIPSSTSGHSRTRCSSIGPCIGRDWQRRVAAAWASSHPPGWLGEGRRRSRCAGLGWQGSCNRAESESWAQQRIGVGMGWGKSEGRTQVEARVRA